MSNNSIDNNARTHEEEIIDLTKDDTDARTHEEEIIDLTNSDQSDMEEEPMSPILSCTHAPTQLSTIDLKKDSVSDSESDIEDDQLWKAVEEYRRRLEEKEAKRQDTIETDSESDEPTQIIPCPTSPTKVRELAQWHPLPEDLGDDGEENSKFSQEDEAWERGEVLDYLRSNPDDTRHRWWKATVFSDYTDNNQKEICMAVEYFESIYATILRIASIICAVMGIEICPKTHRIHAHIIMGFLNAKAYTTLKNKIGISQIRWLTTDQEILGWYDYVVKAFSKISHPRRILRYGEDKILQKKISQARVNKRSHRDLFYDNRQAIEEGRFDEIDPLFRFDHMSKIQKWYNEQHKAAIRVNHDRLVFIWGEPGVGKTSLFSRNIDPNLIYWKSPSNKWWCGYKNQPIVIVDEVTPEQFQSGNINWNIIGDRNEVYVEVKGSQLPLQAQWVIVISNYTLDQLCSVRRRGLNDLLKRIFKRRCGNEEDGYRMYKFPETPKANNGDVKDVSNRVLAIWKKKWYYDIKPYFKHLLNLDV